MDMVQTQKQTYIHEGTTLARALGAPTLFSIFCVLLYYKTNYLLFHTVIGMTEIYIALTTITVAATTNQFTKNYFIIYIAMAFGWSAILNLSHTVSYPGMHLLPYEILIFHLNFELQLKQYSPQHCSHQLIFYDTKSNSGSLTWLLHSSSLPLKWPY